MPTPDAGHAALLVGVGLAAGFLSGIVGMGGALVLVPALAFVAGMPFNEVMTFVDNDFQVFALFGQNELHEVDAGNEAEITLDTYPGRVIKAHVDSAIWAQGQGQLEASGDLPKTTFVPPPGRFPVKLVVAKEDEGLFVAAGARGSAAIYTEHLAAIHILRKVLMRIQSCLDYVIIKHSISLGH